MVLAVLGGVPITFATAQFCGDCWVRAEDMGWLNKALVGGCMGAGVIVFLSSCCCRGPAVSGLCLLGSSPEGNLLWMLLLDAFLQAGAALDQALWPLRVFWLWQVEA